MPTADQTYDEAVALQERGELEQAIAKLGGLLREQPDHALAHAAMSVWCGKVERFDEAVAHAQRVCELEPEDPFSFVALSLICQKAGRISEAEEAGMHARRMQFQA